MSDTSDRLSPPAADRGGPSVRERLEAAGLRPTRQRVALAAALFRAGCRHVTAEALHSEVEAAGAPVSLATVYNTLRAFTDAGLVRQVAVDGARVFFDTNTDAHHHFLDEASGELTDIPADHVAITQLPPPPAGRAVARVDVVVRLSDPAKR